MAKTAVIIGTGSYAPDNIVTNDDIIEQFKGVMVPGKDGDITAKEFIENMSKRVGYKTRRILKDPKENTGTMCVEAGKKAIKDAGIKAEDIDLIVLSTDSPDFLSPATSARVQYELGAKNAGFYDMNTACSGFTTALGNAWSFLMTDPTVKRVLVLGGYSMSRYADPDELLTNFMFADGAGAIIIESRDDSEYGIKAQTLTGDGQYWDYMGIYKGGVDKHFGTAYPKEKLEYVKFLKGFPATVNIDNWPKLVERTLEKTGWSKDDVDLAFFTQVNLSVINKVCEILGWDPSISHNIMEEMGYTGSACVPMAIDDANKKGLLKPGQKIVMCTSGGGASFAAMTLIWGK